MGLRVAGKVARAVVRIGFGGSDLLGTVVVAAAASASSR